MDIPLSGVSFKSHNVTAGIVSISVNGKVYQLKLKSASFLDPVMLYAAVNPLVSQFE